MASVNVLVVTRLQRLRGITFHYGNDRSSGQVGGAPSTLIETTSMPIDAIAEKISCQDGTTLRKLVKREFGTTRGVLR